MAPVTEARPRRRVRHRGPVDTTSQTGPSRSGTAWASSNETGQIDYLETTGSGWSRQRVVLGPLKVTSHLLDGITNQRSMNNSFPQVPHPVNEPVRDYAPGSPERASLQQRIAELKAEVIEIPAFIGGQEVRTGNTEEVRPPHEIAHKLGDVHLCGRGEVERAIEAARSAAKEWAATPWTERAAIFLRAAELIAGPYRDTLNASTMLGQSKNVYQAEIDSACELIDFLRFNVKYMTDLYADQPISSPGTWNRLEYRPLEGFVFAVTPFNFTAIQGNLPLAPALMGNVVLWKPSTTAVYSAYFIYKVLEEAGMPPGVINMLPGHGPDIGDPVFESPHLAGLHYMTDLYADQPISSPGTWNRLEYRPLEGFVFAVTPFNFTAIQGNLPLAPALMGNVVLWKPSTTAVYSAYFIYKVLEEAGMPPGVINMLPGHGPDIGDPVFESPHLAGLHFTGSTNTFRHMWRTIGNNIDRYHAYPRIVGETGGKDFVIAHPSADAKEVATALVRGAFEYQGQKCSAASRAYIPSSRWDVIREEMKSQLSEIRMGTVEDFGNFVNAVIDRKSFDAIVEYIEHAKSSDGIEVVWGGGHSSDEGYFIEPTVLVVDDPSYRTMCEEIFGPVLSIYVYEDSDFEATLDLVDSTSPYALTGAIFARDRRAVQMAMDRLVNAAGNFYINDKPTGAVVGQQPFGGARGSGTNDKAGSAMNLLRWVSARSIKETLNPPKHFSYPFLESDAG